jgi:hypothetical protein
MLLLPLAGGGFALFLYFAIFPLPKPGKVYGIELSPSQFQIVAGALAAIGLIGLGFLAVGLVSSLTHHSRIALTANSIILPKPDWWGNSWGEEEMELRFDEITSTKVVPFVGYAVRLEIIHSGGKVGIPSNMLPSRREFNLLTQLLSVAIDSAYSAALAKRYMGRQTTDNNP